MNEIRGVESSALEKVHTDRDRGSLVEGCPLGLEVHIASKRAAGVTPMKGERAKTINLIVKWGKGVVNIAP